MSATLYDIREAREIAEVDLAHNIKALAVAVRPLGEAGAVMIAKIEANGRELGLLHRQELSIVADGKEIV